MFNLKRGWSILKKKETPQREEKHERLIFASRGLVVDQYVEMIKEGFGLLVTYDVIGEIISYTHLMWDRYSDYKHSSFNKSVKEPEFLKKKKYMDYDYGGYFMMVYNKNHPAYEGVKFKLLQNVYTLEKARQRTFFFEKDFAVNDTDQYEIDLDHMKKKIIEKQTIDYIIITYYAKLYDYDKEVGSIVYTLTIKKQPKSNSKNVDFHVHYNCKKNNRTVHSERGFSTENKIRGKKLSLIKFQRPFHNNINTKLEGLGSTYVTKITLKQYEKTELRCKIGASFRGIYKCIEASFLPNDIKEFGVEAQKVDFFF